MEIKINIVLPDKENKDIVQMVIDAFKDNESNINKEIKVDKKRTLKDDLEPKLCEKCLYFKTYIHPLDDTKGECHGLPPFDYNENRDISLFPTLSKYTKICSLFKKKED